MNTLPSRRVLVVDDDFFVRDLVSTILRDLGCETLEAADGEEAFELTRRQHPALIISDVAMPKADGISLCRQLRQSGDQTPVVLLTNADAAASLRASSSRINGWLPKPTNPERLAVQLRRLVQRWLPKSSKTIGVSLENPLKSH